MEHSTRRVSHRNRDEANTDETQAHVVEENEAVVEADRILDEIDDLLDEIDEDNARQRSLVAVVEEELDEDDDTDPEESTAQALWNLGLYAPVDLADWIREDLSGVCPFCGQNPCIGWSL